jgi:hypothetical protein
MPAKSAALSLVPNVAIAKSFSHGGVKSMNVEAQGNEGSGAGRKERPQQFRNGKNDGGGGHPGEGRQCGWSPEPPHELLHDIGS